ncbi:2-hydroxyacid dehydrogenase [Aquamicrobium ahrensii]|uniref:Glyoxylate/hydroxypyruvate reductase A n=1 Tax=Aquamicrobium ahrensii TaxID=469551 RepID=A0ABV2KNJ4_9HYPH
MSNPGKGRVLLAVNAFQPQRWQELIGNERDVTVEREAGVDPSITYAVVWKQKPNLLVGLPNLKVIFSVGAGVDHIMEDATIPTDIPVVRVVAEDLTRHMVEYVVWRVLDHHRQGRQYREQQRLRAWHDIDQRNAGDVSVGIMGFGHLGRAAASALMALGFHINGWSRSAREMDGVNTYAGEEGLTPFLNATDILVVLLPLTKATTGVIDYKLLKELRRRNALGGSVLINAGRGRLQKEADILRALDDGTLKEASLDVFEIEPLPKTSPLWNHPKVFVTPHAAATSDPRHLVPVMLEQMAAYERGEELENLIDREAGY